MLRSLTALALFAAAAVAQPPAENVAPPPPKTLPPLPEVVREPIPNPNAPPEPPPPSAAGQTVTVDELLPPPRVLLSADFGPAWAWRMGELRPNAAFAARPLNFPVPVAKFSDVVSKNGGSDLAARVALAYTFERMPLSVYGAWETLHAEGNAVLLGYDPQTARLLDGLNDYNQGRREADAEGRWPMLRMRTVPGDEHELRTRLTANIADAVGGWQVWTPRERQGMEYRLLVGGRYAGLFTDDRATGDRYEQSASSWFSGFGPQAGGRIDAVLTGNDGSRGMTLWADVRGGALFGESVQRFREFDGIWGGDTPYRELEQRADRTVPFLAAELGMGTGGPRMRMSMGVRYNHYWGMGDVGPSTQDIGMLSGFLRMEIGF